MPDSNGDGFPFRVRFIGPGFEAFSRTFTEITEDLQDWSEPFDAIQADFYNMMRLRFAGEGAHEGEAAWAPLSPKYAAWKAQEAPGAKILHLDGNLEAAATNPGAPGALQEREPRRLAIWIERWVGGWNLAYLHQFGTGRMPARPVVRVGGDTKIRWVRIIRDYFYGRAQERIAGLHRQIGEMETRYQGMARRG